MILGIPKETAEGEQRVAMAPALLPRLAKAGVEVVIEAEAGLHAGFPDAQYADKGAGIEADRAKLFERADAIAQVRSYGADPDAGESALFQLRSGQVVIGFCEPLAEAERLRPLAERGVNQLSMELMPRITRAQSMDALSSQTSLAGYRSVILAAEALGKIFPMMMTAAGTIKAAKVFVIGAGVAGLQAIATAKRLGATVRAIDVRPAVKEQVESLGAKFIMPEDVAEGEGGYAKELTDQQKLRQQELMAEVIAESDVVITTAAIPGRKSPVLVPKDVVEKMQPGSVIVDLASERGGNCELTQAGQTLEHRGVKILGPVNVPASVAQDASSTYAQNVLAFLTHLLDKEGNIQLDRSDEITAGTLCTCDGQIVHPQVRTALDMEPLPEPGSVGDRTEQSSASAATDTSTETDQAASNEGSDA